MLGWLFVPYYLRTNIYYLRINIITCESMSLDCDSASVYLEGNTHDIHDWLGHDIHMTYTYMTYTIDWVGRLRFTIWYHTRKCDIMMWYHTRKCDIIHVNGGCDSPSFTGESISLLANQHLACLHTCIHAHYIHAQMHDCWASCLFGMIQSKPSLTEQFWHAYMLHAWIDADVLRYADTHTCTRRYAPTDAYCCWAGCLFRITCEPTSIPCPNSSSDVRVCLCVCLYVYVCVCKFMCVSVCLCVCL